MRRPSYCFQQRRRQCTQVSVVPSYALAPIAWFYASNSILFWNSSIVTVYQFDFREDSPITTFGPFALNGVTGLIDSISIFRNTVGAVFVDMHMAEHSPGDVNKLVLLNWKTGASVQIIPSLPPVGLKHNILSD